MCDGSGGTSWTHDKTGRINQERRNIGNGVSHYINYTYNLDGSLKVLQTPPMKQLNYTYSGAARPTQLVDSTDNINFALNATYASPGELAGATLGSASGFTGFTITNYYNDRLQPILLSATNSATGAAVLSDCFDFHLGVAINSAQTPPCSVAAYNPAANNGNVYQITNNRSSTRTQSFTYDSLNRILSGQSGGTGGTTWGDTYVIDAWGNLTNMNPISGKGYGQNFQAAPASVQNQLNGFCNDAAGNLILNILCPQNPIPAYVYDAENRLVWTSGYRYIYDGNGERVEKCQAATATTACPTSGTTGTLYWRGTGSDTLAETDLGGSQQEEYIFFNAQRIARRDVSSTGATIGLHYYFSDHLGSHGVVETVTMTGGTSCDQDIDYYPYGGVENDYCATVPQNYKFTGKERDAESGLDYFVARHHASSLGRFMQADPVGIMKQKLIDPQQWNMYAYVRNNPLRFIDPFGMYTCNGTKAFCARVQVAYEETQKAAAAAEKGSDQQKQLNKVLKFLGKPGEANYVSIKSGSLSAGELGKADTSTSTDLLGNRHTSTQITLDFNQADTTAKLNRRTPLWGTEPQDDAGVLGHEGTHGVDQFPLGHNPATRTQEHATEMNAYRNQSYIYGELGFKSMLDPGLSADTEAQRNQAISAGADRSTAAWCEEGGGCD